MNAPTKSDRHHWDAPTRSYLSSTDLAVIHIARGCAIAERHGGSPPATVLPVHQAIRELGGRPRPVAPASIRPAIAVRRREPGGPARPNRPRHGAVTAATTRLDRAGTPGALAILEDLVAGGERPPVGYETTAHRAWVDWDRLINPPILSSGQLAAVHIARGSGLAERIGGHPPINRSAVLTAIAKVATGRGEAQS